MDASRPYRSVLYIPASNERALEKARSLPADAIIFDLEDAVAPDAKQAARDILVRELAKGGYGNRARLVRVNAANTPWGAADLEAFADSNADGLLLPKVDGPQDLDGPAAVASGKKLWAMMETARGIVNANDIAAHPALEGLVLGTNDLAKELGCRETAGREALMVSLQLCLLAARANRRICIDGVYNAFRDEDGLKRECAQGRDLGFDGKTLIHPAQIAAANRAFAPTEDEMELARRQIAAFEEAEAKGKGVAVVDGRIVENLHIVTARAILQKARAIAEMEG